MVVGAWRARTVPVRQLHSYRRWIRSIRLVIQTSWIDLRLPDMSGFELLERMKSSPDMSSVPVVVFTGKDLSIDEHALLKSMAKSIILKDVRSILSVVFGENAVSNREGYRVAVELLLNLKRIKHPFAAVQIC